jgi:hypothetical protein
MTLEVLVISLLLGVLGSLLANALDRYYEKKYRCGFLGFIYLEALVAWNSAIGRVWGIASLIVRTAKYAYGRVYDGIIAAKDWVVFEVRLYRPVLRSWTPQPFIFIPSRVARIAVITIVVIAIIVTPSLLQKTQPPLSPQVAETALPRSRFIAERKLEELDPGPGEWTYRGARSEYEGTSIEIFHNGQKAFSSGGYYLDFITFPDQAEGHPGFFVEGAGPIHTKDITGDGMPDVLLVESCGCSAGTSTYTLISLGEEVKEIFTTEDWLGEGDWGLKDVDDDGVYEAVGPDFPIMVRDQGYKWAGPSINVILKYKDGNFVYASDLMRREPPTRREFLAAVERAKRDLGDYKIPDFGSYYTDGLPDSVSEYAINLIYTGNGELAHEFINLVFSDEEEEERDYLWRSLYTDLSGQSYWPQLAAMNHWTEDQYILGDMC